MGSEVHSSLPFLNADLTRLDNRVTLYVKAGVTFPTAKGGLHMANGKNGKDGSVYIDRFAAGGISSGVISGAFVAEVHQLLLKRLKKYT